MSQISTERLQLRFPMTTDVDPRHLEWLNDKELMRWSEQRWREHNYDSQRAFLMNALIEGDPLCFDIRIKPYIPDEDPTYTADHPDAGGGKMRYEGSIGTIHAYLDKRHRRADLGIMLGPQYHGKGYAREAWEAVEKYLHENCYIDKFEAGCASGNGRMVKLLLAMLYEFEGTRVDHMEIDGKQWDLLLYGKSYLP